MTEEQFRGLEPGDYIYRIPDTEAPECVGTLSKELEWCRYAVIATPDDDTILVGDDQGMSPRQYLVLTRDDSCGLSDWEETPSDAWRCYASRCRRWATEYGQVAERYEALAEQYEQS